jgi:glycosyltransferase involved in cell wall biosynthesis
MERKKLKIALVSQEYPPETARGGIGSQTYAKAKGLSIRGHNVFVISRSIDQNRHEIQEGNITVIRIPGLENMLPLMTPVVEWLTHSMVVATELEKLHETESLDIVDFPEWGAEAYTYLLNRNEWTKVPTVIQLHGPLVMLAHTIGWPKIDSDFYRLGSEMEAECVRLADAVYSSSQCSTQWIRKHYDRQRKDMPTIHLGVDTAAFAPQAVFKNSNPTIIFIGKVVANKGINELVEAAINLRADFPLLKLRIIGGGEEKFFDSLKRRAQHAGCNELLDFAGYKQKEELPVELSKAHIFAMPSYYEGGPGFSYLEAMSCGLPVIGCEGSGVEEIVTSGVNGLLVPPRNTEALEDAIRTILRDENLMNNMSRAAREFALTFADRDKCLDTLESFYLSVVKQDEVCLVEDNIEIS